MNGKINADMLGLLKLETMVAILEDVMTQIMTFEEPETVAELIIFRDVLTATMRSLIGNEMTNEIIEETKKEVIKALSLRA